MDRENFKRGSFLKHLRTLNGVSEKELAELLDVEPSDIAVWETGIKFPEDSATIEKIAKIFHVTKREVLNGEYKKDRNNTEVDYEIVKDKEDETLSITGKNILIIALSLVVLLILIVSIISVSSSVGKKVYANKADPVSDEREEIIHTPKKSNESIIYNTTAMSSRENNFNFDKLLEHGFTKYGNKYIKKTQYCTIEFEGQEFKIYYPKKSSSITYHYNVYTGEVYEVHSTRMSGTVTIYDNSPSGVRNCETIKCRTFSDYKEYINYLISQIRG